MVLSTKVLRVPVCSVFPGLYTTPLYLWVTVGRVRPRTPSEDSRDVPEGRSENFLKEETLNRFRPGISNYFDDSILTQNVGLLVVGVRCEVDGPTGGTDGVTSEGRHFNSQVTSL